MREYFLDGATNQGISASMSEDQLRRISNKIRSLRLRHASFVNYTSFLPFGRELEAQGLAQNRISNLNATPAKEREFCDPSNEFAAAWSRYANIDDGEPRVLAVGDNQMRDELRTTEESEIPSQLYYFELQDIDGNTITGVETGTVGDECIKTKAYGISQEDRMAEIIEGEGIILVQKNAIDSSGKINPRVVEWFEAIPVKKGQKPINIPKGSIYALVNPDKDRIFVVKHSGRNNDESVNNPDNEPLDNMHGLALHVTDILGSITLEINPNYTETTNIRSGGIRVLPTSKNGKAKLSGWSQD